MPVGYCERQIKVAEVTDKRTRKTKKKKKREDGLKRTTGGNEFN